MRSPSAGLRLAVVVAAIVSLAVAAAIGLERERPIERGLAVRVERVPLDAMDPARDRVGSLLYRGGLWLTSSDPRFGGLSDLRVSADGRRLLAVSDCGRGFSATLAYDAEGRLADIEEPRLIDLLGFDGRPFRPGSGDAESLTVTATALEVGFEGKNRILAYRREPPFGGPPRRVPTPRGLARCGTNGGIEAMALLDDQRLLICEALRAPSREVPAWSGGPAGWIERAYPLLFSGGWGGEPFRPTAATQLPAGDVLVLERRFPPVGARIVRITREVLGQPGPLQGDEIARFESPLTLDNLEGIEVRQVGEGTLVYLLSDDNGCGKGGSSGLRSGLQRTLLLMFALGA